MYVHFTYFNIFSEDPSGSFTKICDVTLPRLLSHTEKCTIFNFIVKSACSSIEIESGFLFDLPWNSQAV